MNTKAAQKLQEMVDTMRRKARTGDTPSDLHCFVFVYKESPRARKVHANAIYKSSVESFLSWCETTMFPKHHTTTLIDWIRAY